MARTKKEPSSPPQVGSTGKKIWKILQTKRSSSKSHSDSSQSQSLPSPQVKLPPRKFNIARKSTGTAMHEVQIAISDSDDSDLLMEDDEEEDETEEEVHTARKSTSAVMVHKPIAPVHHERGKKVLYTAKDGTQKKRYAPGNLHNFLTLTISHFSSSQEPLHFLRFAVFKLKQTRPSRKHRLHALYVKSLSN